MRSGLNTFQQLNSIEDLPQKLNKLKSNHLRAAVDICPPNQNLVMAIRLSTKCLMVSLIRAFANTGW